MVLVPHIMMLARRFARLSTCCCLQVTSGADLGTAGSVTVLYLDSLPTSPSAQNHCATVVGLFLEFLQANRPDAFQGVRTSELYLH